MLITGYKTKPHLLEKIIIIFLGPSLLVYWLLLLAITILSF